MNEPRPADQMRLYYRVCRYGAQLLFAGLTRGRIFGVHHVPRTGGVLLVCNHQSFFDPVLATLALPRECDYMARDTLFRQPLFRRLIESLNAFPIKRASADVGAIKESLRRLKAGHLLTTFPEGTRTEDGSIRAMQPGTVLLARRTRVPMVPCLILGAFEAWPRHAKFPRPHAVLVAYDRPVSAAQIANLTDEEAMTQVRDRILALRARYERHPVLTS